MVAFIAANTGWTWDHILDTMTTPRFLALQEQWRLRPPAHWLVASALKYKPPQKHVDVIEGPAPGISIAALKAAFG